MDVIGSVLEYLKNRFILMAQPLNGWEMQDIWEILLHHNWRMIWTFIKRERFHAAVNSLCKSLGDSFRILLLQVNCFTLTSDLFMDINFGILLIIILRIYSSNLFRVTHISIYNFRHHSDSGMSPILWQSLIFTNAGILSIGPLGNKFSEI